MFGRLRLRLWEIEDLTEPEMVFCCDDDLSRRRPPPGFVAFHSPAEKAAYRERRRSMTPADKLREARGR